MTNRKLYDLLSSTNDIICNKIQVFDTSDEPMDIPRPKGDTYFVEVVLNIRHLFFKAI